MKKKVFYTELAYLLGLLAIAWGTACMERVDFGVSMVVAPAYILHLKISEFLPFFSFGMAEYTLQAIILFLMMIILQKVKLSYFFCHSHFIWFYAGWCDCDGCSYPFKRSV